MSFARRRKARKNSATPDLPVLLADISARQSASRTAVVQSRLNTQVPAPVTDPLIEIFSPAGQAAAATHRFSDQFTDRVNPRKLT